MHKRQQISGICKTIWSLVTILRYTAPKNGSQKQAVMEARSLGGRVFIPWRTGTPERVPVAGVWLPSHASTQPLLLSTVCQAPLPVVCSSMYVVTKAKHKGAQVIASKGVFWCRLQIVSNTHDRKYQIQGSTNGHRGSAKEL